MDSLKKRLGFRENGGQEESAERKCNVSVSNKGGKFLASWQSMKYGKTLFALDSSTLFSLADSPVWMLGECYVRNGHYSLNSQETVNGVTAFHRDFRSKIWFTYRKNFEEFHGTNVTSDSGWGCMIRSGQMLLANALVFLKLGRHWRTKVKLKPSYEAHDEICNELLHREIIRLFADNPQNPLSIHAMMKIAVDLFRQKPGDWFGPSATAHILQKAINFGQSNSLLSNIKVYVAQHGTLYKDDIVSMCTSTASSDSSSVDSHINMDEYSIIDVNELAATSAQVLHTSTCEDAVSGLSTLSWSPVIVLIPLRLGQDRKSNPIYTPCLRSFLACDTCVGIIGGKPQHSLYFVGFQGENLIYLDPHLLQDNVDVTNDEFSLDSFHTKNPRKLHASKMDSSCCVGFLFTNQLQFEDWCEMALELAKPSLPSQTHYPLFSIIDGKNQVMRINEEFAQAEILHHVNQLDSIDESAIDAMLVIPQSDEDEFVFL